MDNTEENTVELHGDEEIIEVIELNDTEPGPGMYQTIFESLLVVLYFFLERSGCFFPEKWTVKTNLEPLFTSIASPDQMM